MAQQLEQCAAVGSRELLRNVKLGLFCSVHCPGKLVVRTYELVRGLRDAGVTLVGGFHSPMEQECLRLILRGGSPVIVCPARSVTDMRLHPEWKAPIQTGRLLVMSPFAPDVKRVTRETALVRNAFVANLVDELFVAYANPGGNTEQLCRDALAHGQRVLTFGEPENQRLIEFGAQPTGVRVGQAMPASAEVAGAGAAGSGTTAAGATSEVGATRRWKT
jgi:predicted Rossmann fold nucleotide-binding protein DprA/Smf involved in DNA uptake